MANTRWFTVRPAPLQGKVTDFIRGVVIIAGKGTVQDVDMTRQEYLDRLSPDQQDELRRMKETNDNAAATNKIVASVNADLETANRDFEEATNARATAIRTLGSTASASDVDSHARRYQILEVHRYRIALGQGDR